MFKELREIQKTAGAIFNADSIPVSFENDRLALQAVYEGVAVWDGSHWGKILVTDEDRLRFLHNQSTNNFNSLKVGESCQTVFITSTARIIDLATAYICEDAVLLLVSPNRREKIYQWLDRYIFFADKVKLTDVTETTAMFTVMGPKSRALLEHFWAGQMSEQPFSNHQVLSLNGIEIRVAVGSGLATEGYTLIVAEKDAAMLWKILTNSGAVPLGETVWNQLRIEQGRPLPEQELTEDYNPLEARLMQTISFDKGCYIGQETIARLNTYKGVKQFLWGLRLNGQAKVGDLITAGGEKIGTLTSYIETDKGPIGLGYIRSKAGGLGLKVKVGEGETEAEIIDLPFLHPPLQYS